MASKWCDPSSPSLNQVLHVIKSTEIKSSVEKMEFKIENSINLDLKQPTILMFIQKIAKQANFKDEKLTTAKMLGDFMLLDSDLLKLKPSFLAAVSIYCTNVLNRK
jgi:hypothetical protein